VAQEKQKKKPYITCFNIIMKRYNQEIIMGFYILKLMLSMVKEELVETLKITIMINQTNNLNKIRNNRLNIKKIFNYRINKLNRTKKIIIKSESRSALLYLYKTS